MFFLIIKFYSRRSWACPCFRRFWHFLHLLMPIHGSLRHRFLAQMHNLLLIFRAQKECSWVVFIQLEHPFCFWAILVWRCWVSWVFSASVHLQLLLSFSDTRTNSWSHYPSTRPTDNVESLWLWLNYCFWGQYLQPKVDKSYQPSQKFLFHVFFVSQSSKTKSWSFGIGYVHLWNSYQGLQRFQLSIFIFLEVCSIIQVVFGQHSALLTTSAMPITMQLIPRLMIMYCSYCSGSTEHQSRQCLPLLLHQIINKYCISLYRK